MNNTQRIIGGVSGTLAILVSAYLATHNVSGWGWVTFVGFLIIWAVIK